MKSGIKRIVELLTAYEALGGDDKSAEQRIELLDRAHRQLHRLRAAQLVRTGVERARLTDAMRSPKNGLERHAWNLESGSPAGDFSDLRLKLSKFKSLGNKLMRQGLAYEVVDAVQELDREVRNELKTRGLECNEPYWSEHLIGLYHRLTDKPLQSCLDPPVYSIEGDKQLFEFYDVLASEVLKKLVAVREKERRESDHSKPTLLEELQGLAPPFTWGEVLYHYITYLTDNRDSIGLKALDKFFPTQRYCLKCDRLFRVSKYNPGHFICPRCSAKARATRYRERKKSKD